MQTMAPSKNRITRDIMPTSDVTARISDAFEGLMSTQTSRTGHTAARVASVLAQGVPPEVVALQLNLNTPELVKPFRADDMLVIEQLYAANRRRVALTKRQNLQLIRLQKSDEDGREVLVAPV